LLKSKTDSICKTGRLGTKHRAKIITVIARGREILKLTCMHCGKSFEDNDNAKFCSQSCRDSHIIALEKRVRESVKDDPSQTRKLVD